jgi:hypothetical protein
LQLTDSFLLFLDYESDTVIQAYRKNDLSTLHQFGLRKDYTNPKFTKSDTCKQDNNSVMIIDNGLYVKKLFVRPDRQGEALAFETAPLSRRHEILNSSSYNLTSTDIIAVPVSNNANKLFYFFSSGNYDWVEPKPVLQEDISTIPNIYLNSLCVNEQRRTIVSAYRFLNLIQFYDLEGNLKTSVTIGDPVALPEIDYNRKEVDILHTVKYNIDIYATSNYIYCLYNGDSAYSVPSTILVFTWNGKHVKTLRFNRSLQKIAVDKSDTCLFAIATREPENKALFEGTVYPRPKVICVFVLR